MIASARLYFFLSLVIVLFCFSAWQTEMIRIGITANFILILALILDFALTQNPHFFSIRREVSERLSIGRENLVILHLSYSGKSKVACSVIDGVALKLNADQSEFRIQAQPGSLKKLVYKVFPTKRGVYEFSDIYLY